MNPALWISKTGLDAQQTRLSVISNNLANANTTGFKKDRAEFVDLLYQNVRQVGGATTQDTRLATGLNIGTGVRVASNTKQHTQGNIITTDNSLDLAVQGRGFFQITRTDGTISYTRNGEFKLDDQGQMVTSKGEPLQPSITVPANTLSLTIGSDGTVSALQQGASTPSQIGTIQLADFVNPAGLQPIGDNQFLESASSGSPQTGTPGLNGIGELLQGALETSNVNVVEELVGMIETQRVYEMNSRSISTADQMLEFVTNNV